MPENEKILNFWFPAIIYSGIIFCVSGIPNLKAPGAEHNLDKVIHFMEYIPLGFLVCRALRVNFFGLDAKTLLSLAVFITSLYAMSDEFHQSFVPGRSCDWHDWLADTIGSMVGSSLFLVQHLRKQERHR
jgi:VanZ family protein